MGANEDTQGGLIVNIFFYYYDLGTHFSVYGL